MAPNKADYDMWKGFTEANLRNVVMYVERWPDAYLERAHPCPRNFMKPREVGDMRVPICSGEGACKLIV